MVGNFSGVLARDGGTLPRVGFLRSMGLQKSFGSVSLPIDMALFLEIGGNKDASSMLVLRYCGRVANSSDPTNPGGMALVFYLASPY